MVKLKDIFGGIIREKTGMQQKVDTYNNVISIYDSIISNINNIENETINVLKKNPESIYNLIFIKEERLKYQYCNGQISDKDYITAQDILKNQLDETIANYIDSMQNHFIEILRTKLNRTKEEHLHLVGVNHMNFDSYENIKLSKEIAQSVKAAFQSGKEYEDAKKVADIIIRCSINKHMRRG